MVARTADAPVTCGGVSSGAGPEPDEADASVTRVPPPRDPEDAAVTQIMPVIAPWPAPGEEPPPPPSLWFASDTSVRGVATVDTDAVDPSAETLVGEVVPDPPERPGPVALESDSWDAPAAAPVPRRAGSPKLWIGVGLALAALIAAIALPLALGGGDDPGSPTTAGLPTALDEPGQISAESSGPAATPLATAAAAAPSLSANPTSTAAAPSSAQTQPAPTTATSTANPPAPPPPPPFTPVTFEAEDGTRTGSATIWDGYPSASGGRLVRNIGNWGGTPGTLRINNVTIPTTAAYTITIYYVHPDGEANRSATVTVSGNSALTMNFTGNATCCQTKVLSNITISAGTHTITFANPTSHAPSIDRVVISRP
jgi:hypothetical protein